MKRLFSLLLVAIAFGIAAQAQKTYAIITGVSNYEGTANDLNQSTKDAKSLAVLYKSKGATVALLTSQNATRANVIATIRKVKKVATSADRIVFSFSGHGIANTLCTYTSGQSTDMLSYSDLFAELDKCQARDIVCYIDACFSGTAVGGMHSKAMHDNDKAMQGSGKAVPDGDKAWTNVIKGSQRYIVYLSSRSDETSAENPLVGAGFMTNGILKGLRGKADANNDRKVTAMELFRYVHRDVQLHNKKQHPQLVTSKALYDNVLMSW